MSFEAGERLGRLGGLGLKTVGALKILFVEVYKVNEALDVNVSCRRASQLIEWLGIDGL